MRNPAEIEQEFNYFAGKPVTSKELPDDTTEIKEDTFIFLENANQTEVTLYIFKNGKKYKGPTFTEV